MAIASRSQVVLLGPGTSTKVRIMSPVWKPLAVKVAQVSHDGLIFFERLASAELRKNTHRAVNNKKDFIVRNSKTVSIFATFPNIS